MTVAHLHFPVMTVSTMFFRPFEEHKTTTVDCDHKVFTTHDWGTQPYKQQFYFLLANKLVISYAIV